MKTVIGYLRGGLFAIALASCAITTLVGCAHARPDQARHRRVIAAHTHQDTNIAHSAAYSRAETSPTAQVDLSEPAQIVNEDAHARSFAPGPMFHATEIATWFDDNDAPESISMLELRNACGLDLDYAFGPDSQAHNATPRRVLDSHSIQTQQVPTGYWLHLWHAGRWLAAATTLAETGLIELSADCERLEVHVETDAGPASFAIHWELDVATGVLPTAQVPDTIELSLDLEPTPEQWGTELAEPSERVQLRLLNLCAEAATYAFTPEASSEPGHSSTLAAHSERFVEVPAQWWLQYQLLDEGWRGGATTNHSGSSLWIAPNCIDYGIGDGDVIGRF